MTEDERFMQCALREARAASAEGEIPVGAAAVLDGKIVSLAHNERETLRDPTAHAEVLAIRKAARTLGRRRLHDVTLYVTLEPCPMCAGAILAAGMKRVVYGARDAKAGCAGSVYRITEDPAFDAFVPSDGGVLETECKEALDTFFTQKRRGEADMTNLEIMEKAQNWLDTHREEMIADLQTLARIPSVSREDLPSEGAPFGRDVKEALDKALSMAEAYGFRAYDHEGYCGSAVWGDKEHAIGIFGHMDVVPEGDKWIYPPYGATRVGDFLIGRGVSDNKSACVLGLYVMRCFKENNIPLRHGIRCVFGCNEECGMADMRYFAKTQTMPVISFVPDASFPVNYAQKGMLRGYLSIEVGADILCMEAGEVMNMVPPHATCLLNVPYASAKDKVTGERIACEDENGLLRVRATGVASHAASPDNGVSAIHEMAVALEKAGILCEASQKAVHSIAVLSDDTRGKACGIACSDPESGETTLVSGVITTAESGKKLLVSVDARLSIASDLDKVESAFADFCAEYGFTREASLHIEKPFYMPKDDPRVVTLMEVYRDATGRDDPPYTMGGGTYSKDLENALTFGMGFPGSDHRPEGLPEGHGGAHAPDEYLYIPDLLRALPLFVAAILRLDGIVD